MPTLLHEHLRTITADDVKNRLEVGGDIALIDVLPVSSFTKRHIPGALNIPFPRLKQTVPRAVPSHGTDVIIYDAGGDSEVSARAARLLVDMGYTKVRYLTGGLRGWREAGNTYSGSHRG